VRVGVDRLRGVLQGLVHRGDDAGDGGVDVGDRLGGFHLADGGAGRDAVADRRQLDVDDVSQRVLGVVGDAHPDDHAVGVAVLDHRPFVLVGVAAVIGGGHAASSPVTEGRTAGCHLPPDFGEAY